MNLGMELKAEPIEPFCNNTCGTCMYLVQARNPKHEAIKSGTLPKAPTLWLNPDIHDFYDFDNSRKLKDIKLEGYEHLGVIKMPVTE